MNHFEGRLERIGPKPIEHFFGTEVEAENDVVLHPDHVAYVMRGTKIVSMFYGERVKV